MMTIFLKYAPERTDFPNSDPTNSQMLSEVKST